MQIWCEDCDCRCTGLLWSLGCARRMEISGLMGLDYCPVMGSYCILSVRRKASNTGETDEDILEDKDVDDEYIEDHLTQPQPVSKSMMTRPTRISIILQSLLKMLNTSSGIIYQL